MPFRINRSLIAFLHDGTMAAVSFVLSVYLRLGEDNWSQAMTFLLPGTVIFTAVALSAFVYMRLYRGLWRFASIEDLLAITRAVSLAVIIFAAMMFLVSRLEGMPRSVLIINWMLLILMLGAPRFAYRLIKDKGLLFAFKRESRAVPLLLMGAGEAAERFVRETLRSNARNYTVVGILDDNPLRHDRTLHGIRIFGNTDILPVVIRKLERKGKKPHRIIVTNSVEPAKLETWMRIADEFGLSLARLPRIDEFDNRLAERRVLRQIAIEDLLGRAQIVCNKEKMRAFLQGKAILVTGAGGSIGSELTRQLAAYSPKIIILYELSEYALYSIDLEIRTTFPDIESIAVLGDVKNYRQLQQALADYQPDMVFHTAAIKHVPLSETNPIEAIQTNVVGTRNLIRACCEQGVESAVLISTDKAVNPTNIMGASKRLAERCFLQAACQETTHFITVRFGNVLGSAGSVVPLFQRQLRQGGPLTVTHPDMVRYFMTIREAVDLVIQAASLGHESSLRQALYVLDMGTPIKILDLARQMIRLSGLVPDKDIRIQFTGLRPGEKLYEELFYPQEAPDKTVIPGVLQAHLQTQSDAGLEESLATLERCCNERRAAEAVALLKQLVPEFTP